MLKDIKKAIKDYNKAIELDPEDNISKDWLRICVENIEKDKVAK